MTVGTQRCALEGPCLNVTVDDRHFLGTSSGGGPTDSRNCSSLVLDIVGDGSLWMIDVAEGTLRQFALQPPNASKTLKASHVNKIFVTHMHPDHVMGLPTFLRSTLGFPHPEKLSSRGTPPRINLYGPAGLRAFLRNTLSLTRTHTADRYAVHELLTPTDPRTPCNDEALYDNEEPGQDVLCDEHGYWRDFAEGRSFRGVVNVCAGPLVHRDPCIGFVIHESASLPAPRKLAILGDTSSAARLTHLVSSTPGRLLLLVHEATDAYIPADIDPQLAARRPRALIASKVQERGHSTATEAGACAGKWGARQLVLNHIGTRFPAPSPGSRAGKRVAMMREIERQAIEACRVTPCEVPVPGATTLAEKEQGQGQGQGAEEEEDCKVVVAYDFLTVQISLQSNHDQGGGGGGNQAASRQPAGTRNSRPPKRRRKAHANANDAR
ncbi:beta-lactamase-like protein [Russula compacta]|nr:beta-lactamase-like protein [Russula compacta]